MSRESFVLFWWHIRVAYRFAPHAFHWGCSRTSMAKWWAMAGLYFSASEIRSALKRAVMVGLMVERYHPMTGCRCYHCAGHPWGWMA